MADCNDIPAPGQIPFEADEILIYGIPVASSTGRVISVPVSNGGSGYGSAPDVQFSGGGGRGAAATALVTSGAVSGIRMDSFGVGYGTPPAVKLEGGGATTNASLGTPVLGQTLLAVLNLEEGKWDIAIEGVFAGDKSQPPPFQIAAAYGYAYEGHCYRFDRPRVLAFQGRDGVNAKGCGYDIPANLGYKMWRIKSNKRIIELTVAVDNAEKIILEANLPGRRPPNTYSAHMQLAHRGGRLTNT
jgi:hypothetical protein